MIDEMKKKSNPIYERNTLEFVTVALEYCAFVEHENRLYSNQLVVLSFAFVAEL